MPYQNRVSPQGELVATAARGTLMGNRGCLLNAQQQIRRLYQVQRWIICVLAFKNRKHPLMQPGIYTPLFFLDEATALAAGHRPCAECQRQRFTTFRHAWAMANPELAGSSQPLAPIVDAALHRERLVADGTRASTRKATWRATLAELPSGTFVQLALHAQPYLVHREVLYPWSFAGYREPVRHSGATRVLVLTPPSTVRALAYGYVPQLHPSAARDG